jgi:hypothetical protein
MLSALKKHFLRTNFQLPFRARGTDIEDRDHWHLRALASLQLSICPPRPAFDSQLCQCGLADLHHRV